MTQKPNKPIDARAIGAGLRKMQLDALAANGLMVVDANVFEKMRARLDAATDVIKRARLWSPHDGALAYAIRAYEEAIRQ